MRVTVDLYGGARAAVGQRSIEVSVADDASVEDVIVAMFVVAPSLVFLKEAAALIVNRRQVEPRQRIHEGDRIALLPAVAGG